MKNNFSKILWFSLIIGWFNSFAQNQIEWKPNGPTTFPVNISGQINGIGRVTSIKFHPSNSQIIYATSATGGLWITKNKGKSWESMGTDFLPQLNSASVCIDNVNDSIIYLGTGDPNYYFTSYGVYKTYNAGKTWAPANSGMGNRMAIEIIMDPNNHNTLVAATNNGIFKSTDGGASWVSVLGSGNFTDMQANPDTTTHTLYACTMSDFFKSEDFGNTWNKITVGLTSGNNSGIRIGVTPKNPSVVYVGMVTGEGTIFKSSDAGTSFVLKRLKPSESITGYDANGKGQGNYNFAICVDPEDEDVVYTASHCVWKSSDGGVNFTKLTDWPSILHTDMHYIGFSPYNHLELYNGNDGGVWISETNNRSDWKPISDNLGATECYHASTSPIRKDIISIGTQDNGGLFTSSNIWKTNRGGDWSSVEVIDYSDQNQVYYLNNGNRRSLDEGNPTNETTFNPPFTMDGNTNNGTHLIFSPYNYDIAFLQYNNVWRCMNLNNGKPVWTPLFPTTKNISNIYLSPNNPKRLYIILNNKTILISNNAFKDSLEFDTIKIPTTPINSFLCEIQGNENELFFSSGSKVYISKNKGATWTQTSTNLPNLTLIGMLQDPFASGENVYVANNSAVYKYNSTTSSWDLFTQKLPSVANINELMEFNNGSKESVLRVAFYGRGVWEAPYVRNDSIKANFNSIKESCKEGLIRFVDKSLGEPTLLEWSFPGGIPNASNAKSPEITYTESGNYSVKLIVTKGSKKDTIIKNDYIKIVDPVNPTIEIKNGSMVSSPAPSYQWLKNGSFIAGAISRSYKPTQPGNYTVIVTDSNFCVTESEVVKFPFTVGLASDFANQISITPNPTSDYLNINLFDLGIKNGLYKIINLEGKVVDSGSINKQSKEFKINVRSFANGVYFLNIQIGEMQISKEFIKN